MISTKGDCQYKPFCLCKFSLVGDAKLEYIALCFNHDNYLVGLSGVPDYKLVLWDWKQGVRLHSVETSIRVSENLDC